MRVLTAQKGIFKDEGIIESRISFAPFVRFLKEKAANEADTRAFYYRKLVDKFEQIPAALVPLNGPEEVAAHQELLDIVAASVFPVTADMDKDIYGIGMPYKFAIFYYSEQFKKVFTKDGEHLATVPHGFGTDKVARDKKEWLYKLILQRVYKFPVNYDTEIIHTVATPENGSGIKGYVKVKVDPRFVDVKVKGEIPELTYDQVCTKKVCLDWLEEILPLSMFALEGFVIWTVKDVTQEQVLSRVKDLVMNMNETNEIQSYRKLEENILAASQLKEAAVHLLPVPKINGRYVLESRFSETDIVLGLKGNEKQQQHLFQQLLEYMLHNPQPLVIPDVNESTVQLYSFLKYLPLKGIKSIIIAPIMHEDELLGIVELASTVENGINLESLGQLEPIHPMAVLLLSRSLDILKSRITGVIKEQFTALQSAVEWKFTDAAWQYLHTPATERKDIGNITFEDVYPLYGAIDIRNSSVERSNAIHEDLREQLLLIKDTLHQVDGTIHLPLLEEVRFKNEALLGDISNNMVSEEEQQINDFLNQEIAPLFRHLYDSHTQLQPALDTYFKTIDKSEGHILHHRQEYEESLASINMAISKYLDKEKENIQLSFPCYFEKYRTDGLEYNIYIGQSISQRQKFDLLYLRNLRLWQLSSMAEIARLTHKLKGELKVPLQTTQLILAHSNPIDISFRQDERRFDVEGAYNIRYEIMKKRIDKVHIQPGGERLTQPNTIAVVYSYVKEMEEYRKYIHFLQNKNVLKPGIEMLDLEELQGISGLKAMRVEVNLEQE
ncbi:GAF domain-containing protein [Chitinophaga sp. GbtcB8]|uniref:GAF domain-containing protein n=1 Tax=Chitinophaga sp. GbtcB8 TaxID=2824753 RepID=UPI001C2FEAC7|nr:GAF domain-containing protein [Chitinophaga sp. GbtcB8]